jgi:hypothetical protein
LKVVSPRVLDAARSVRADLLSRAPAERDLAGQCALASMRIAETVGDASVFRVGFFMRRETFLGRRGRYPSPHAWCQVAGTIVDVTATQFGRFPAVYVVAAVDTDRYVECAQGAQAIGEVMREWRLNRVPEYRRLRRKLRELDDAA